MIVRKDKSFVKLGLYPDSDWLGDADWVLDDNTQQELEEKIASLYPNFDFVTDEKGQLIDVEAIEPSINNIIENKVLELSDICTQTIYNGIDVTLSDGKVEHFTLTERDQLNLSGIALKLLMGAEVVAWHEDDEGKNCRFYNKIDAYKFISELTTFKEYNITYFRDLRIYVRSLNKIEDIENITYGYELPEEFKSDVLKEYEKLVAENN